MRRPVENENRYILLGEQFFGKPIRGAVVLITGKTGTEENCLLIGPVLFAVQLAANVAALLVDFKVFFPYL